MTTAILMTVLNLVKYTQQTYQSSLMAQPFKDPVLSPLWLWFDLWPRNFCVPWVQPKKHKQLTILTTFKGTVMRSTFTVLYGQSPELS